MRDRELVEALKMRALPEGSGDYESLVGFLRLYRDAVRIVVNRLWSLDKTPSISTLHKMFYGELRALGLRAHQVKQVYVYARAVVKAAKRNGGKKPLEPKGSNVVARGDPPETVHSFPLGLTVEPGAGSIAQPEQGATKLGEKH